MNGTNLVCSTVHQLAPDNQYFFITSYLTQKKQHHAIFEWELPGSP